MKFTALLLLPIFLLVLVHQASSQNRYIVAVVESLKTMQNETRSVCPATIITDRHVITTADCAQPTNSSYELKVQVQMSAPGSWGTSTVSIDRIFEHPNRTATTNNIAIIMIGGQFNVTLLPPRKIASTNSNATCSLYGWYGALDNPESATVQVFSPEFCNPALPQAYCSFINATVSDRACFAHPGSPLVCSSGDVNAILLRTNPLNSNQCVLDQLNRPLIHYLSMGDYKEWIEKTSGADIATKFSAILLVTAFLVAMKNFS